MSEVYSKRTVEIRVGGRYRLGKKIGTGSFGEIFEGTDIFDNSPVAIKLEHNTVKYPQLLFEAKLLKSIPGTGIPTMHWFGIAGEYNAMVMELLGQNLEDLFNYCTKNFTLKTILMITIQIIERIKHVHENNYVHRDIKPENFLVGKDNTSKIIYILDFGLAKRYRDEQSRRDDMESIAYVLLYFFKGKLPWQGLKCKDKNEKYAKIKDMKMSITPEKLCEGFPIEFANYLTKVKKLGFEEEPAYKDYIKMFNDLFKSKDFEMDYMYDWVTVKNNTNVLKEASLLRSQEYSKQDESKKNEGVDSTIQGKNNDTNPMGNYQQNVEKDMQNDNNIYEEDENKTPDPKKRGKNNKKDNCILF